MPGVVAVLTGAELAGFDPYWGHAIKDRPILAIDRVRFAGEPVAAVAAEDEAIAEAAAARDRRRLRGAAGASARSRRRSPTTRRSCTRASCARGSSTGSASSPTREGNVCYRYRLDAGSVELAEADAELTVEGEYEFPAVYQYAMETHTVVADVRRRRASPSGPPASTRSWSAPRSPTCSSCRSGACG